MECTKSIIRHRFKPGMMIGALVLLSVLTISSAGYTVTLPIPFLTFKKAPVVEPIVPVQVHSHEVQNHHHDIHHHHHQDNNLHHLDSDHDHHHHHHHHDHGHLDQSGKLYLHGDSTVKFYYKENMHGPVNHVDVYNDHCREVPMDYWYNRPKSLWAKHCITLYQSGNCKGNGVQVAGSVLELRSAGMHYGVNSFKPCEKNIRIRFMPSANHKHKHHHHHH